MAVVYYRGVLYYYILHHSFLSTIHSKAIPLPLAQSHVAEIFSISDVNKNGKSIIRCSRCEGVAELLRGKSYQLVAGSITKAKEHIAIHCP